VRQCATLSSYVMAGLVPAIHALLW
jgi:hypothetical protein